MHNRTYTHNSWWLALSLVTKLKLDLGLQLQIMDINKYSFHIDVAVASLGLDCSDIDFVSLSNV